MTQTVNEAVHFRNDVLIGTNSEIAASDILQADKVADLLAKSLRPNSCPLDWIVRPTPEIRALLSEDCNESSYKLQDCNEGKVFLREDI
ncbi:unnamed protein product [Dovyalis caffra]|uniref:Uncharacterized protein n=1 Tax=Dovyalis caffra TaxID=77055 RepID=A0AAV1SDJ3_9ROSI|nr:unnamed protein product [Dovyalis caffra]